MHTLLVVDDDEAILGTYGPALRHAGYSVYTATSGPQGLQLARQHLPDLILCDINMPGMDGRHVLRSLREDANLALKQIVLMTGNTHTITPRSGMELGADDFLVKPIEFQELLSCVAARLQRAQLHWRVGDQIVSDLRASLRSTLPHEFFTPLAGILGLVEVLQGEWPQLKSEEISELLTEINNSGWRLHRTLKNYLLLLELQGQLRTEKPVQPVLSPPETKSAVIFGLDSVSNRGNRRKDISCEIEDCSLCAESGDISVMVEELLENACSFSPPGTPVRLHLSADGILSISDQGRGMTPEQIQQIGAFQQFDRKHLEQQGLGLGLTIVGQLAARCGARLLIESRPGHGTTASVTFSCSSPDPALAPSLPSYAAK